MKNSEWWAQDYGFFGKFYVEGDDSLEGYLAKDHLSLNERTKREVDGVITLLAPYIKGRILDVPCGYGRHSIELAKRGFKMIGSDINIAHLDKAKKDSGKRKLFLEFRKENMLKIKYVEEFDAVINMFYSFGFFEKDEDNEQVLKNFYKALMFGGKFLMHTDVNIPRILEGKYKCDETRTLKSGKKLHIIENYNQATKRMNGIWILTDEKGKEEKKDYSVRVYEKDEFIQMCLKVGFCECKAYGDWDGRPYSENSEEIMFVATK